MVLLNKYIAIFIYDILAQVTSCNTLLEALDLFISIHECMYIHSRDRTILRCTVYFVNNKLLGYINQTSSQVS